MSAEESPQVDVEVNLKSPTEPEGNATAQTAAEPRKRPRLDFSAALGGRGGAAGKEDGRERRRGKSMFGILVGTLNKAKIEDKERNASEAAKKRQLIEQRLQAKLRKETDSVRRAEDAKKDKTAANRKEEELQLKDSIYKLRRTRLPVLSNFLLTSDVISSDSEAEKKDPLAPPPRSHPPPLYYLPKILLPQQEAFLERRKREVSAAAQAEWTNFKNTERVTGIEEIQTLRQRAADEDKRARMEKEGGEGDVDMDVGDSGGQNNNPKENGEGKGDMDMAMDEHPAKGEKEKRKVKEESAGADNEDGDEDAVEY